MIHELQTYQAPPKAAPAMVAEQLRPLLLSPLNTLAERNEVSAGFDLISAPANPVWILARVASLLSPYYEKDTPQSVREMTAEDWVVSLEQFPEWAINDAVRWWKGPDNPKRHKAPIEGDIAERAWQITDVVRAAKLRVEAFDDGPPPVRAIAPPRPALPDMAARARLVEELWTGVKRFPGQGSAQEPAKEVTQ